MALHKLNPLLYIDPSAETNMAEVTGKMGRAQCIREWLPSVQDPCLRVNYESWLDSYDRSLTEERDRLLHPATAKPKEEDPADRVDRIMAEYTKAHTVPQPPICERVK